MRQVAVRRFPIRYSIQRWNDSLWFYGALLIVLLVIMGGKLMAHQPVLDFLAPLVLTVGILIVLWLMRRFSYVQLGDDGLHVRYVLRHYDVPYACVSRVRRQPLDVAFQPAERRRFVNRFVRRLSKEPAAYIRLDRRQEGLVEEAERRLGPRFVSGADVVVPILGVDAFITEVKGHLRAAST